MPEAAREVWITGIGIVSCLGEGPDAHWQALTHATPTADATTHAPYLIHQLAPINLDRQIPKKGDQRQMEPWQRIGTYAAGLALDSAGVKGDAAVLGRMDMIVAAGGGERDVAVDSAILSQLPDNQDPSAFLNERLMNDLRPTLFLAQLSNLLAGNISIVHGVSGSSRTLMGEENAGVDAARIALSRIVAGQGEIALVGGAHNADRKDLLLQSELGKYNFTGPFAPVWDRPAPGGLILGSMGAFLVLESAAHARARQASPIARLSAVLSERAHPAEDGFHTALSKMWDALAPRLDPEHLAILSGATGVEPATGQERAFLGAHRGIPVRATGTHIGHGFEPQFVINLALAALVAQHGNLFPPTGTVETASEASVRQVAVTSVSHWRGAGLGLVEAA